MKRIFRCFYCQSKCCMKKYDSSVLEKNIKNIYKNKFLRNDIEKGILKDEGIALFTNPNNIKLKTPLDNISNTSNVSNNSINKNVVNKNVVNKNVNTSNNLNVNTLKEFFKKKDGSDTSSSNISDSESNKYKLKLMSPKKTKSGNTRGFVI